MPRRRNWQPDPNRVIVVAAGQIARRQATERAIYNCQNRRPFLPARWMAFYADGKIDLLSEIEGAPEDDVMLAHRRDLDRIAEQSKHSPYLQRTIFHLSNLQSVGPVINDKSDRNGHRTAWTQSHRYTTIAKLKHARRTSELDISKPSRRSAREPDGNKNARH